jgi:hypothetical protein
MALVCCLLLMDTHLLKTNLRTLFFYLDVLGRLKAVQPLGQVFKRGQTLEDKREFVLENIRFNKKN